MTDYSQVSVPENKPAEDYHWTERRAEILQMIEQKGHPWGFNKSQLGRRYGVSDQQIHDDFDRLKEWYQDRIGTDAKVVSDLAFQRIIQEHMSNGEYEKARRALKTWNEWLQDTGEQASEPDQLEMMGEGGGPLDVTINREEYNNDE
jgi:hypothetical protein